MATPEKGKSRKEKKKRETESERERERDRKRVFIYIYIYIKIPFSPLWVVCVYSSTSGPLPEICCVSWDVLEPLFQLRGHSS